jgi:hypothetical protein
MLADKRDQRDPTTLGRLILQREDKTVPAHVEADRILTVSENQNGRKPHDS